QKVMAKKMLTWATVDPDNAEEMAEFHLEMYRELLRDCLDDDPDLETFVFANIDTGRPFHASPLQQDHIRPAGKKLGIMGLGWHTFRHSYRTMIDDLGTPIGVQQKLMRHADIRTTMNIYGSAFEETKRRVNAKVAELVLPATSSLLQ